MTAPRADPCRAVTADAVEALRVLVATASSIAASDPATFSPSSADAQAVLATLTDVTTTLTSARDWMKSVALDGTNASVASNVNISVSLNVADPLFRAVRAAGRIAKATSSPAAASLVAQMQAVLDRAVSLGGAGGRCYVGDYVPPGDRVAPLAVPATCDELNAASLAPLGASLAAATQRAQDDVAAHASNPAVEYPQAALTYLGLASDALAPIAAVSGSAADPAAAASIADALATAGANLTYGEYWETVSATNMASLEARDAFELQEQALAAVRKITALAGTCEQAPATSSGLVVMDLHEVELPSTYIITLNRVDVTGSVEPWMGDSSQFNGVTSYPELSDSGQWESNQELCDRGWPGPMAYEGHALCPNWTPDNYYVYGAQLGVSVKPKGQQMPLPAIATACSLGEVQTDHTVTLGNCEANAVSNGLFNQKQPLSLSFTVSPGDEATFGVALDNIENANAASLSSVIGSNSAAVSASGDGIQVVGNLLAVDGAIIAGASSLGTVGALFGVLGGALSIVGDLMGSSDQPSPGACGDPTYYEHTCVGGVMGSPKHVYDPQTGDEHDDPAPDTMWLHFTKEKLAEITATGPRTYEFSTEMLGIEESPQYGCYTGVKFQLTIQRDWSTGPAAAARSGDMAIVRAPNDVEAVSALAAAPGTLETSLQLYSGFGDYFSGQTFRSNLSDGPTLVSLASRTPQILDGFRVDALGNLGEMSRLPPDLAWRQRTIDTSGRYPAGAPSTAVSRTPQNLDVFAIASDGDVYDTYWNSAMGLFGDGLPNWGATPITHGDCQVPTVSCPHSGIPGGGVAAVSRVPNQLDVFYVGIDGGIWTSSYVDGAPKWTTWEIQGPASTFQPGEALAVPGAPIAAVARDSQTVDVFFLGKDGGLWTSSWQAGGSWGTWEIAGTAHTAMSGSPLSAVARQPGAIDVAYLGPDTGAGAPVQWASWTSHLPWSLSTIAGATAKTAPFPAALSLVAPTSYGLQLFVSDGDRAVSSFEWSDPTTCSTLRPEGCPSRPTDFPWKKARISVAEECTVCQH